MSTIEQTKAFDELTETIQKMAEENMKKERCSCCTANATRYLKIWLCDRHMNKYGEIKDI